MKRLTLIFIFTCCGGLLLAQNTFRFKRTIHSEEGWHSITVPPDLFAHASRDLSDLRILHIHGADTLEVPYLLRERISTITRKKVELPMLNKSTRGDTLFVTFEQHSTKRFNHITLLFSNSNYFAKVTIEGSDDRDAWFELTRDAPVFSIEQDGETISHNDVSFPQSDYRWVRIRVLSDTGLELASAWLEHHETTPGAYVDIPLSWNTRNEATTKETCLNITLDHYRPVSILEIAIRHNIDYYRPFRLEYVVDSVRSEKGWKRVYSTAAQGYLTSLRPALIEFEPVESKVLRLRITNHDSQPLTVDHVSARAPIVDLISNLPGSNTFLFYGNKSLRAPVYDLAMFKDRLPTDPRPATIGPEENIHIAEDQHYSSLSKTWLWIVMIAGISVLGFFTFKMMAKS